MSDAERPPDVDSKPTEGVLPYASLETQARGVRFGDIVLAGVGMLVGTGFILVIGFFVAMINWSERVDSGVFLAWAVVFGVVVAASAVGIWMLVRRRPVRYFFLGGLIGLGLMSLIEGVCFFGSIGKA